MPLQCIELYCSSREQLWLMRMFPGKQLPFSVGRNLEDVAAGIENIFVIEDSRGIDASHQRNRSCFTHQNVGGHAIVLPVHISCERPGIGDSSPRNRYCRNDL